MPRDGRKHISYARSAVSFEGNVLILFFFADPTTIR